MNTFALKLQSKAYIIGSLISIVAAYDYLLDVRYINKVYDIKQEINKPVLAISKKVHKIEPKKLKDELIVMMQIYWQFRHPLSQEHIITRVELVEQDKLIHEDRNSLFEMTLPQGTFYGRINEKSLMQNDFANIQSQSQIIGIPILLI
ncbi:unnamed protein product (macronuclear) [Paramecium tetraurelia]|uniref:Uncharacterized protein n=1 Tax=Paramecium tetraurelia TaxID=5888 RepID=A0CN22_PARTE|nr:uncharacterized protein GSPATT00008630001 [Paramecium tetraurelia]CAK72189.1 unnamed protein product [Paramecium tetraurelia]|eukprot:XP_001439586.1 hypothetical protein (macronuclear) [Paramecium tetraurelia strain d4-2]